MGNRDSQAQSIKFNNQQYNVTVTLMNGDAEFPLPLGIVREINIIDSIHSIFTEAIITINNTGNVLDEFVTDPQLRKVIIGEDYRFNSEGHDLIRLKIVPTDPNSNNDSFPDNIFAIETIYSIYDEVESTAGEDSTTKTKMFLLKDYREVLLEKTRLSWSTADAVRSTSDRQLNLSRLGNSQRKAKTGVAIKHLLQSALPEGAFKSSAWEDGATSIFYTSGIGCNAFCDLEYLLDKHLADNGDNSVLLARNLELNLMSISDLMNRRNPLNESRIGELMSFPSLSPKFENPEDPSSTSVIPGYTVTSDQLNDSPTSNNFSLLNISNIDSDTELITPIVHNYSSYDKQFSIDCELNNITKIKERMQNLYANNFPNVDGTSQKSILPINESKVDNRTVNHFYSTGNTQIERLKGGINKVLRKALALSPTMLISTEGYTPRRPGRSALVGIQDIDRRSPLAKVLLGEWMMTKISHLFIINGEQYLNDIVLNKTHAFEEIISPERLEQFNNQYEELKA